MTALLLVLLVVLILLNGFFVAAEFALVRARRSRMEEEAKQGSRSARLALHQMDHLSEYLSAAQVGITMTSIGLGFLGEPAVATLLEPVFGGVMSHGVAVVISVALAYLLVTSAHVIVGEQAPKMTAITHAESVARWCARPLEWFRVGLHPVIWALNGASNFVVKRILRIDVESDSEAATAEELRVLIGRGERYGELDPGEADDARRGFPPARAAGATGDDADPGARDRELRRHGGGRAAALHHLRPHAAARDRGRQPRPGAGRGPLQPAGAGADGEGPDAPIAPLVREALIMPETKPLDDLLTDLRSQRASLAVIADEFGRTAGIVTIEDIIEEIVGEIVDETDPLLSSVRQLVNGDWFVRGHVSLGDLDDVGISLPVDSDAYTTVGGYVFGQLGRLPKRGDQITANGYAIRVESVRENRVEAVRIHPTGELDPQSG